MADQNITALPVATLPASSDQLLLVGATEEKLIDYDKLADAILTKLTSKQYTLDQGTKTLPAALNELNSKTLSALRQVDGNVEDWNNIASPGIYSGNGSTSKNTPIEATIWINAFVVPSNGNLKYLTAYAITDKGIFFRSMNNGRWEAWLQIK